MRALLAAAARLGAAAAVAGIVLAAARWGPVHARPPLDVRALPLFPAAVALAALAALLGERAARGRRRRPGPRALAAALVAAAGALALVVTLRPPAGLPADVASPQGVVARLPAGPIEVNGPRLHAVPFVRRWTFLWDGPLRVERSGTYRLWATGRGAVEVAIDGRVVLRGEGDTLRAGADVFIGHGSHRIEATLHRVGAGPRLRLGWTRPDGVDEALPVRALGAPLSRAWWWATDVLALLCAGLIGLLAWSVDWSRPRPLPAPRPVTRGEGVASLLGHAALFVLMSWPLATSPARLGVTNRPDGRLNAWILAWDAHALGHAPGRVFDAPAFHPLRDALAFSEHLLLPAAVVAPLQKGGPVLAYNAVLALSMVLSGLATQLLIRRVSGARLAAFVGAALFAVGAHRWIRLAHVQAQVTVFLPLLLLALDRFWRRRTLGNALLAGLVLALQGLSSIYVGAVAAVALGAALLCGAASLRRAEWLRLLAGGALAAALLAPVALPYLRMRGAQGVEWTRQDVATYATTLESYAASGTRLYGRLTQVHLDPERVQDTLFPGVVPLVLGLAGLAAAPRRYRAVGVAGALLAVALSLGPQTALYRFLYDNVVLVRGVRALSRLSLLPVLVLSVFTGLALARARWTHALLALALALAESTNAPIGYGRWEGPPPAARWLAGREGAVVALPAGEDDTRAMLEGTAHWLPLVNGDSGFMPRPYTRALELLQGDDEEEALRFLRAAGVAHAVSRAARAWPLLAHFGEERVYAVPAGEPARVIAPAAAAATLWAADAAVVDLGRLRRVDRLVFEIDERPWVARPALEASDDGRAWTAVAARASLADATLTLYRDPRRGRGELRFEAVAARFLRVDPQLPARAVAFEADPAPMK